MIEFEKDMLTWADSFTHARSSLYSWQKSSNLYLVSIHPFFIIDWKALLQAKGLSKKAFQTMAEKGQWVVSFEIISKLDSFYAIGSKYIDAQNIVRVVALGGQK